MASPNRAGRLLGGLAAVLLLVVGGTVAIGFRAHAFFRENGASTVLPSPMRLSSTPRAWIDPSGTRIVAVSDESAGLRRRILLWTRVR